MASELVSYGGWQKILRLKNAEVEVLMTTEVGPRVIRFGFIEGANEFVEYPDQMGKVGGNEYRSYGGHRLWVAPEVHGMTDHPDNHPVGWKEEHNEATLIAPTEIGTHLQKQIRVRLDEKRNHVHVLHKVTNRGTAIVTIAPWALSVMAPGGRAIVPLSPHIPHSERVLPSRRMALWGYTDMSDPRWKWGKQFVQLRQEANIESVQKFGMLVTQGWAAYANGGRLFLKRFPYLPDVIYPDFGVNAEVFTNKRMLEVESLGPLTTLKPGESILHEEDWFLFRNIQIGLTDESIEGVMKPLLDFAG
jgi:hypothetical protein